MEVVRLIESQRVDEDDKPLKECVIAQCGVFVEEKESIM